MAGQQPTEFDVGIRIVQVSRFETCGVCGDSLRAGPVSLCRVCDRGIHRDCLAFVRACPTFGCRGAAVPVAPAGPATPARGAARPPGSGACAKLPVAGPARRDHSGGIPEPGLLALGTAACEVADTLARICLVLLVSPFLVLPWLSALDYFLGARMAILVLGCLLGEGLRRLVLAGLE